jgi:hypothetical protein
MLFRSGMIGFVGSGGCAHVAWDVASAGPPVLTYGWCGGLNDDIGPSFGSHAWLCWLR